MRVLIRLTALWAGTLMGFASPLWAEEAYRLHIEGQSLSDSLKAFAEQSGLQVVYFADVAEGKLGKRLMGTYTANAALDELLSDTALVYQSVDPHTVIVQSLKPSTSAAHETSLPPKPSSPLLLAQSNARAERHEVGQAQATAQADVMDNGNARANERHDSALEEVVVTATKRGAQSMQDVPFSIRAISGSTLQEKGVERYVDWARLVPGLIAQDQGPGEKRFIIRGVQSVGPATVGVYFDDAVITGSNLEDDGGGRNADIRLYDVERIEVLRGPQGTLYGAGSLSGTIRIITTKPDPTQNSGAVQTNLAATHSGDPSYKVNGHFNVPLVQDKLAIRGVGWYEDEGGFVDNVRLGRDDINDETTYGGRLAARFLASENFSLTASAAIQRTKLNGKQRYFPAIGDLETDEYIVDRYKDDLELFQLSASYRTGLGTLEASTNLLQRDVLYRIDSTPILLFFGVPYPAAITVNDQPDKRDLWSNEIRFASSFKGPVQAVVGASYQREKKDFTSNVFSASVEGLPLVSEPDVFGRVSAYTNNQYALFGEFTYALTERLSALVGVRYFDFDLKSRSRSTVPFGGLQGPAPPPDPNRAAAESKVTTKFSISYKVNEGTNVYALASEGFRSGGTNSTGFGTLVIIPEEFESDSIWNYEVGAKTSWLNERLILNMSAYFIDWSNIQTIQQEPVQGFQYIGNAGGAAVKGFELEFFARPATNLDFTLSAGFQDARLTEDQPALVEATFPVGKDGDRIPSVPRLTGAVSSKYSAPLGRRLRGVVRGDLAYVGSSFSQFNDDGLFQNKQDAYTIVDVRAGVQGERWEAFLFANNVFDKRAAITVVENRIMPRSVFTNRPRSIGISITRNF